ncbi:FAD-dependent oxidoreductase [Haladaptatus sp. CMAA 1911]|uniref:FAD-dependent oxidoreductase n=1 Tax=unclassified Haladaptatus TaxID=2622732 RepID=UPI003754C695
MSLATVPRYDSSQITTRGDHAVVVGASMAGLITARVLKDAFETVTVIDRDSLTDEPVARRGVPQARHPHVLWEAGRATLEDLFPGYSEDLLAAGAVTIDGKTDLFNYTRGDFLASGREEFKLYSATRPLYEHVVRHHVSELERVTIQSGCQFIDYLVDDAATVVDGVVLRNRDGEQEDLHADLVVDATGRTSRTPTWLKSHGVRPPIAEEVHVNVTYSSIFIERPADDHRTFVVMAEAPRTRGGMAAPVEGDRWLVNLHGVHGDHPPKDDKNLLDFAASLPTPELKQLLNDHSHVGNEVFHYPFPANRWYHYEDLDRFPDGLVVIGDAVASFNPIYGQGMSVAALEALVLHQALATGHEDLAVRFFDRAAPVIDNAWKMAIGADFGFPQTEGSKPRGLSVFNWYMSRLFRRAHTDGALTDAFVRVLTLQKPSSTLLRPTIMWRVFKPTSST